MRRALRGRPSLVPLEKLRRVNPQGQCQAGKGIQRHVVAAPLKALDVLKGKPCQLRKTFLRNLLGFADGLQVRSEPLAQVLAWPRKLGEMAGHFGFQRFALKPSRC